jgi:hypothetical protein
MGIAMASRASAGTGVGPGASRYFFSIETSSYVMMRRVIMNMQQDRDFLQPTTRYAFFHVFAVV